jgi:PAS domain S-box-containing protein
MENRPNLRLCFALSHGGNGTMAQADGGPQGGGGHEFLAGGGELGELIRGVDWRSTPLGDPANWPQALRIALRIMLASRQPIWIGWGRELTYFYNDPYKSIIGGKHPWALGRPTREVWSEIWDDIGPMLDAALGGEQGTFVESQLLIMQRNGYPEETYYTFSYSPIPTDDGRAVGGIICANSDDTQRVIGERQLALLRELGAATADARSWEDVCARSGQALATDASDLTFAAIYMAERDADEVMLAASCGIASDHPALPAKAPIADGTWPFAQAIREQALALVEDAGSRFASGLPGGAWRKPASKAVVLPIVPGGDSGRIGALVVGLNPYRLFDDNYEGFLRLVAAQIAAAIANAQAYEAERRRAEALAEIDRAKTTFFSNVSHEFRTPLTLMIGPIEDALAEAHVLPAEQRERLDLAHRNSLRLLKLVNSLLDFSRIEAGRIEAVYEPTDLSTLTAELASNFRSAVDRAGLQLRIDCPRLPAAHVDRDMWEKIVLNLLSNAFKFTFDGHIGVSLRKAADGNALELVVEDTGVGIPDHELPRLFERFHRIDGQRSRSFEGSGIGLALVQELVHLHGGTIAADSQVGRGTRFTVRVPLGSTHLPAERVGSERRLASSALRAGIYVEEALRWLPGSAGALEPRAADAEEAAHPLRVTEARILVVDDNADMREYVQRLLGSRWQVETAADGAEALQAIRRQPPDLVLSDVMMPRLDGYGLLRALRADPAVRDLPVILLSARAGEEARVEGLDAGADDYLTKPFAARELIARVNANLELAHVRREAMRELRESEERFRNMADHAPVMMWVTDGSGFCTYLNRGWYEFTGQAREEALGLGWLEAVHPDDRGAARAAFIGATATHSPFRVEYRLRRADGVYRWAIDAAAPRYDGAGNFVGFIGSVIDITERKEAEQVLQRANDDLELRVATAISERLDAEAQLRQAQKMEAVGKLTGGVAHDFNNVLQVIGGNLQLLARDVAGNPRAEQRLQSAIGGIARGSKLASQLLAFGRRQPLAPKVVNLGRLIRNVDDMLRRALGEGVEVETVIAGGLWNTFIDVIQLENALLNLAINARDAMKGQGRLTIEAGNAFLDDAYAKRHAEVAPGQYVMLAVSDTGCGIPAELIEQVFEPFFTTKPEGEGTGLGLSMVYGLVKQSGGHIKIYSEPGEGTTVRIYLPRSREQEDIEVNVETGPPVGGTETVLVVEDDEDVRATVVEMLSDLGYRVLKAKDAQSALTIVDSGVPIDVLFTDVVMPGPLRSPELARKTRERIPSVAVLFTSGYTENAIVHGGRLDDGIDLLSKPYTREALARKLRHALRNRQQASRPPWAPAAGAPASGSARQGLRILLVEDNGMIRMTTADMLQSLGHVVTEAADGEEALALLERETPDVLVTDLSLPGISGAELAALACRRLPGLALVFATGYDVGGDSVDASIAGRPVALRKPYDEQALSEALRSALARIPETA